MQMNLHTLVLTGNRRRVAGMGSVLRAPFGVFFGFLFLSLACRGLDSCELAPSEFDALLSLRDQFGLRCLWRSPEPPCEWAGVTCEKLSGWIPETRVTRIVLESKRLRGVIPPEIGRLVALRELSLRGNAISGVIPAEIGRCGRLEVLNLRRNLLSGEIPLEFSLLRQLKTLDLSSNRFSGEIAFLERFSALEFLSLSGNLFTGKIPSQLASFPKLQWLDLLGNNFDSEVPPLLSKSLTEWRHFSGHFDERPSIRSRKNFLPKRFTLIENSTANSNSSFHRNSKSNSTIVAPSPAPSPLPHKGSKFMRNKRLLITGFFLGTSIGIASCIIFSIFYRVVVNIIRGRKKPAGPIIYSPLIKKAELLRFLETEEGISSLNIIGRGGCGEVYRAQLPVSNGLVIAIKKIHHPETDPKNLTEEDTKHMNKKLRQIKSELETVGHIRHRNLLPLLASVARPDCHYLIYEYMKNGSLQSVLMEVEDGQRELDWLTRHRIAMGIAAGLRYLHFHHSPKIIHRDLKPANVLLNDNLDSRIADFGLAKSVPDLNTHATTSSVAGTVGYIAPEYHQTLKFTDKCDVYSFGVVLAVLVTGRQPSDEFFQHTNEMIMVKWLRNMISSDDPKQAIDQKLLNSGYEEQMLLVLKIACFCTFDDPTDRPNSKDVYQMLAQIRH